MYDDEVELNIDPRISVFFISIILLFLIYSLIDRRFKN